mmetsp:Transcript_149606/g.261463  ORF Transcript_149606/g.261463 Transcript_149606/m.261463 type:complete len:292 (-) Transcript_149606:462-1337(-)
MCFRTRRSSRWCSSCCWSSMKSARLACSSSRWTATTCSSSSFATFRDHRVSSFSSKPCLKLRNSRSWVPMVFLASARSFSSWSFWSFRSCTARSLPNISPSELSSCLSTFCFTAPSSLMSWSMTSMSSSRRVICCCSSTFSIIRELTCSSLFSSISCSCCTCLFRSSMVPAISFSRSTWDCSSSSMLVRTLSLLYTRFSLSFSCCSSWFLVRFRFAIVLSWPMIAFSCCFTCCSNRWFVLPRLAMSLIKFASSVWELLSCWMVWSLLAVLDRNSCTFFSRSSFAAVRSSMI